MIVKIDPLIMPYDRKIQNLCRVPYHGHPKGCPNHGKKPGCPPNERLIDRYFDMDSDLFVIYSVFNIGEFAERMRKTHPQWKDQPRQWYNPRRWQGVARKRQKQEIEAFLEEHPDMAVNTYPEAFGVNVSGLMNNIGIELNWEWPPEHVLEGKKYLENLDYRIALGGKPFDESITRLL